MIILNYLNPRLFPILVKCLFFKKFQTPNAHPSNLPNVPAILHELIIELMGPVHDVDDEDSDDGAQIFLESSSDSDSNDDDPPVNVE